MTGSVVACSPEAGVLSEGPRWHAEHGVLLWVDIVASRLHRGRLGEDRDLEIIETIELDRHVGAVAPVEGGGYIAAAGQGFVFVSADGSLLELAQPERGNLAVRMNDGACDPQGRLWAGTMAYDEKPGAGALYRLELDGSCTKVLDGLDISNGIGWSPTGDTMYLSDSGTACIQAFSFDPASGAITAARPFVEFARPGVVPDGLTVDDEGFLWVAAFGGGAVHRYDPEGRLTVLIPLPVDRPTSCAFGGEDRSTLYVTTARHGLSGPDLVRQPDAGRLFRIDGLGVTGPPCVSYKGTVGPN